MMEQNINFEQLKQRILPYFIKIYGQEYQDIIIKRINQIEPIFYDTLDSKKAIMNRMLSAKRVELTIKFLEENNIHLSQELEREIILSNSTYKLSDVPEAYNLLNACFNNNEYREVAYGGIKNIVRIPTEEIYQIKQSIETLSKLGVVVNAENYNEWLSTDEAKQVFAKIDTLKDFIAILDEEFNKVARNFESTKALINKSDELKRNLNEKYMIDFLKSLEKYTTDYDKKLIEEYLSSDKKDWYSFIRKINICQVIGNSFIGNGLLESFGSKAECKMNDANASDYIKKTIIDNRIKYYRLLGLYEDQMPIEEFLLTEEAIKNIPSQKFIDEIALKKEQYANLLEEELLQITSSYKQDLAKIKDLGLVTDSNYKIEDIKNGMICINPNVRIVNDQPEAVALLLFSPGKCLPEFIDTMFIHEINHAIELSLLEYESGKGKYKCGFEIITDNEEEIRDYECFSEVINQLIAIEITEEMHKDNVYLFNDQDTAKTRGGTSYEHQRMFVDEFWKNFKSAIMRARIDSNMSSLLNLIGKENFEKLNNIIKDYKELPYYQMMDDVINKKDTELTRKRIELYNSAQNINLEMIEHTKQFFNYDIDTEMAK